MIIHPKLPDWIARLDAYVARSAAMAFEWGAHDCALGAANAIEAQTGVDHASPFRGRYSTLEGGLILLREAGFETHADFAASVLPEIPVARAQVGDIAAVDFGAFGITLMLVAGHRIIGPMPDMAGNLALTRAFRAFAVGRQA